MIQQGKSYECQPEMRMRKFLPNHHNSHFYGVSNSPTAPSDDSQDTFPPQEVGGKALLSESV